MEWIVEAETLEDLIDGKVLKQQEHIGHWIFVHPLQENDPGAYICSECKTGDWDIDPAKDKVCKFCRAKMERE